MNWERSCGAVVFTRRDGQLLFVIVQESPGTFSFPKGHMEDTETEVETARREILEETGLQVEFVDGFRRQETYQLAEKPGTRKTVIYFLAKFHNGSPVPQEGEIQRVLLLPYKEAIGLFRHEGTRRILDDAYRFLT